MIFYSGFETLCLCALVPLCLSALVPLCLCALYLIMVPAEPTDSDLAQVNDRKETPEDQIFTDQETDGTVNNPGDTLFKFLMAGLHAVL